VFLTGVGNEVSVKIIDKYTNENWDTIIVNYDSEVSLIITSPLNNTDTNQEIINVSGTTDAEDGAELFIFNDGIFQTQTIINAGSWSGTVLLTGIGNYVSVKVIDKYTNENWDTITLNYVDSVEVKILFPENNIDTTNSNIVLAGTSSNVTDGTIIFININGVLAATTNVSSNSWNSNVVLSDSVNVISVRIVDDFTNEDWDTIIINYHYHNFEVNPLNEIRSETSGNKVYFSKKVFNSGNNYDSFGLEVGNQKLWNCYYLVDNDSDGVYDLGENELITSIYNLKNNDTFFLFLVIEIPDNSVAYETAVISETYVCLADNNYVNGTDTVTVLSPNLILTKNESSFYGYQPEDTVELNVNIYNSGNGTAYEVIYYDTLSVDFSFINTSFEIDTGFGFQNLTSINDSDELEIISSNVLKCNFLKNSFSGLEPASGFKLKYIIKIK
jgi:uncharacterized repeat protein (TIGR01451 family)